MTDKTTLLDVSNQAEVNQFSVDVALHFLNESKAVLLRIAADVSPHEVAEHIAECFDDEGSHTPQTLAVCAALRAGAADAAIAGLMGLY